MKKIVPLFAAFLFASCADSETSNQFSNGTAKKPLSVQSTFYFETDESVLTAEQLDELELFIEPWSTHEIAGVFVEGHTDHRASDLYNLELAGDRVEHIRQEVQARLPRLSPITFTQSFGELLANKNTNKSQELQGDRRVTVRLLVRDVANHSCGYLTDRDQKLNNGIENLGCSTNSNLAKSMAFPVPKEIEIGNPDPNHAAEAIVRYRTDKVKTSDSEAESQ